MIIQREAAGLLRPFIKCLWASDEEGSIVPAYRERMIPTGHMHVVYRLSDRPIRIFDSVDDPVGQSFGFGVVGGLRSSYYIKDVCRPVRTVGAVLHPGVASSLFRVKAEELAGSHTSLDLLWGQSSMDLLEQLHETAMLQKQLIVFESFLETKLSKHFSVHPAVAYALKVIPRTGNIRKIVQETGYSHKHFIQLFRNAVGLSPVLYGRILRLQHALKILSDPGVSLIDVALQAEYSDQAHFNREFREFAGISPGEYRNSDAESHHVPITTPQKVNFIQYMNASSVENIGRRTNHED